MEVFVVTAGEYSDYRIDAVFLNLREAEKYCAFTNKGNPDLYLQIETYETEDGAEWYSQDTPVYYCYHFSTTKRDGDFARTLIPYAYVSEKQKDSITYKKRGDIVYTTFTIYLDKPSREEAIRVAKELMRDNPYSEENTEEASYPYPF
jgi:hypothetical protein